MDTADFEKLVGLIRTNDPNTVLGVRASHCFQQFHRHTQIFKNAYGQIEEVEGDGPAAVQGRVDAALTYHHLISCNNGAIVGLKTVTNVAMFPGETDGFDDEHPIANHLEMIGQYIWQFKSAVTEHLGDATDYTVANPMTKGQVLTATDNLLEQLDVYQEEFGADYMALFP